MSAHSAPADGLYVATSLSPQIRSDAERGDPPGHNYLLSSFFSPNLNRRKDELGGSIANRSTFPRRVVDAVRRVTVGRVAVLTEFNMADGVEGGLWLEASLQFAALLGLPHDVSE